METFIIFRYTAAERLYTDTVVTFERVIFVKINLIMQASFSGRMNAAGVLCKVYFLHHY